MRLLPLVTAFSVIATATAFAAPAVKTVETEKGKVITAENGMTLYTYKKDEKGESYCYDKCATNWPPYLAEGSAAADGDYTLVERKDGKKQWALKGMPLYFWIKDKKSGDATGDGVGEVWDAARP